jgi:hypothetical protein
MFYIGVNCSQEITTWCQLTNVISPTWRKTLLESINGRRFSSFKTRPKGNRLIWESIQYGAANLIPLITDYYHSYNSWRGWDGVSYRRARIGP